MNKEIFKTYLIYFIVLVLFVGVRIASNLGAFGFISNSVLRGSVATLIIQVGLMVLVPFVLSILFLKKRPKQYFKDCSFNKISFKVVLLTFALGVLLFLFNLIVANFFNNIINNLGYSPSTGGGESSSPQTISNVALFLIDTLTVAILPGICEEIMHRGFLMRNVGSKSNYKYAILVSAICFGIMHLNIEQFFYATILGVIIGFVGCVTENIIPCIILHFTNNFLSVYLTYAKKEGWLFGNFMSEVNNIYENNSPIFTFLFTLIVFGLLVVGIIYLIFKLFKETKLKRLQKSLINVQKEISGEDLQNQSTEKLSTDFRDYILPHINKNQSAFNTFLPESTNNKTPNLSTSIFLYSTIFLGILITIFTFVWGIL